MPEPKLAELEIIEVCNELQNVFNKSPLITRKCVVSYNSLLLLHNKLEIPTMHLNTIFVTILKAFQSKEKYLKLITHLVIQKIGKETPDSFLSINSLLKDCTNDTYKVSALKALFSVIPDQMINDYQNILLQGYLSRKEEIETTATAIYYFLLKNNKTNNWITTPGENNTKVKMALNFEFKKNDLSYLEDLLKKSDFKGENGSFLAKIASYLYLQDNKKDLYLKNALDLKFGQELVFIEAAKQVLQFRDEGIFKFLDLIIQNLKPLLRSKKEVLKFSALKIAKTLSFKFSKQCESLSQEVEELINDSNKNVNILAATIILQIGNEESANRLIKNVVSIFNTLKGSYKNFLVDAVTTIQLKIQSKNQEYINFYKAALEDKNQDFQIFLLKKIEKIIFTNPLPYISLLSNYIEDSLNFKTTIFILGVLAQHIPKYKISDDFLKENILIHICNRLILENNLVRISALECLTNVAKHFDFLKDEVIYKLNEFLKDEDLKESAIFLLNTFDLESLPLNEQESQFLQIETKKPEKLIKECREIVLNQNDIKVLVKKIILPDQVDLIFTLSNILSGILIPQGYFFVTIFNDEKLEKNFDFQLNPNESKEFKLSIPIAFLKSNTYINSNLDYSLCPENDITDLENESINLIPFQISFLDFYEPFPVLQDLQFNNSISLILNCTNLTQAMDLVLRTLNLQIVNKQEENNEIKIVLSGKLEDDLVKVCVVLWEDVSIKMECKVFSNNEEVARRVVELFE